MSRPRGGGEAAAPAVTLAVSVIPRSSREEVAGFSEGVVRIRLTAPPVENRANESLVRFLAAALDLPRSAIALSVGGRSRRKLVRIRGLSRAEIFRRLGLGEPPEKDKG